jgi:hypothetical protein
MVNVSFHTNLHLTISLSVIKEIGLWAINVSAILWRSVLYVEETKVSEENIMNLVYKYRLAYMVCGFISLLSQLKFAVSRCTRKNFMW